jgi:diguanylate cyclase (GGDEF)-like protein
MNEKMPKILVVDDERLNVEVLKGLLRDQYSIMVAMNGEQALEAARSETRPDLILLDIMMPRMDGYEVCQKLKADQNTKEIPVIFVTAMTSTDDETKGFDVGAVDYITKPIKIAVAKARIKTHLELKAQKDHLATLSMRDGLTGVANRRKFDAYFENEYQKALTEHINLPLLMIDIDCFKSYNDYYGYLEGDDALKQIAKTIESKMESSTDMVARYGGELFSCVLPVRDYHAMVAIAETILDAIRALKIPHEASTVSDNLTVSIGGINFVPQSHSHIEDAIVLAEDMLYHAKESGRNRFVKVANHLI